MPKSGYYPMKPSFEVYSLPFPTAELCLLGPSPGSRDIPVSWHRWKADGSYPFT